MFNREEVESYYVIMTKENKAWLIVERDRERWNICCCFSDHSIIDERNEQNRYYFQVLSFSFFFHQRVLILFIAQLNYLAADLVLG